VAEALRLKDLCCAHPSAFVAELNAALGGEACGASSSSSPPPPPSPPSSQTNVKVEGAPPPPPYDLPFPDDASVDALPLSTDAKQHIRALRDALNDSPLAAFLPTPTEVMDGLDRMGTASATARGEVDRCVGRAADAAVAAALSRDPQQPPPTVVEVCGAPSLAALSNRHVAKYMSPQGRVVLVGAAAHSVGPMPGHGLGVGISDADELVGQLVSVLRAGGDIGHSSSLEPYATRQVRRNGLQLAAAESLACVYGHNDTREFKMLRSAGMLAVHGSGVLKGHVARHILGYEN
jgi:2-polyprenyl-6-methoxyphenol hydroxylase-like FAD-dependent oxidoreductase